MATVADIWDVVGPYLTAEQLELDDVELHGRGQGQMVRIVVDGDGVNVDRLAEVSRGLSRLLDRQPGLGDSYQLEVSSPGLERKLRRPSHYVKSVGREVVAKVSIGEGKATIRGVIAEADDRSFTVEGETGSQVVAYDDVLSANTVFKWEKAPKPGHKESK